MAILSPEHLLEQAYRLIKPTSQGQRGKPRQVDLRRAVSAAYYAIFHLLAAALADQFVGSGHRSTRRYALAYRALDHSRLRELCNDLGKQMPPSRYHAHLPVVGLSRDFKDFCQAILQLQDARHDADYSPFESVLRADAHATIDLAQSTAVLWNQISGDERSALLTLLVFRPR